MTTKKKTAIKAANDNKPPKVKSANNILGWIILVAALIAGIYFSFY